MKQRRIVFVVFEGFQPLDLFGPYEVFQHAHHLTGGYSCQITAPLPGPVSSGSGVPVHAPYGVADLDPAGIDTLVVAGGGGIDRARHDPTLTRWITTAGATARRVTSVCSGVFLLAAAGLLAGRRVTTHCARGAARPRASRTGRRLRSDLPQGWAGVDVRRGDGGDGPRTRLVEDDLGREVAHAVAQEMVMFLRRPGSQSQFSVALWSAQPASDPIRAAVTAIHSDPGARHGINDLALHAGLSPRHLQRRFTAELGIPPATYVEGVRIEAAKRALAESAHSIETIARRYGFGTAETLRRAFHRHLSVAPSDYRDRFRSTKERL